MGLLPDDIVPFETADRLPPRYRAPWEEVTHEQVFELGGAAVPDDRAAAAAQHLGIDVGDVELITSPQGARLRMHTRPAEAGQHRRSRSG